MTPAQYREEIERQIDGWHIPLSNGQITLDKGLESMESFKLEAQDVPLVIKLVENPKYDIGLFAGNVSLHNHDCIHLLLGRGLRVKDEAFVIGYTMGSTKKMPRWRRNLYMFCAKYLFPEGYSFGEEERFVFNTAVLAGSKCPTDLSKVDFNREKNGKRRISALRKELGIDKDLLKNCYEVEKTCFGSSKESWRLL
jgi:hypothetical protein